MDFWDMTSFNLADRYHFQCKTEGSVGRIVHSESQQIKTSPGYSDRHFVVLLCTARGKLERESTRMKKKVKKKKNEPQ
jgi:hypothetical protein